MSRSIFYLVLIIALSMLSAMAIEAWGAVRLRRFVNRPWAIATWRERFPQASLGEIEQFLITFVEAFGINAGHRWAFRPDDRILDI